MLHSIYMGTEGRNPRSDVCGKSTKGTEWFPGDGGEDKEQQGEGEGDGRRREEITSGTPKGKGTAARGRALTDTANITASQEKANTVLPPSGAEHVPQSRAAEAETIVPSGAGRAESSRATGAERLRAVPPKPPVPQLWTSKFYAAVWPAKSSKAPHMHGVPMDEMARLSVGERQEGAREGAGHSHHRLGLLEEEMDINGEDESQGSKQKRRDEGDREYSDGKEEKEDDREEDRVEERKVKRPRAGGSKRKIQGTGKYYTPACEPCDDNGMRCEKQKKAWVCVQCVIKKVACQRGRGEKQKNARDSGPDEDSNNEAAMSNAERSARQCVAVPRKGPDRKGKGRDNIPLFH